MKTDIETLRQTFKYGYEAYEESYKEYRKIEDAYHNRYYDRHQLDKLRDRGQAPETFNVVKLMSRAMLGYFSTVINSIKTVPLEESETEKSKLFNKMIDYILRENDFEVKKEDILLNALSSGLLVTKMGVERTGEKDQYGRDHNKITIDVVDPMSVVMDPMSKEYDYIDGRFLHVYAWVTKSDLQLTYSKEKIEELDEYFNHLNIDEANREFLYGENISGYDKVGEEYLVVNTQIRDDKGINRLITWCGETILSNEVIPYKSGVLPYRVVKLHQTRKAEFYGIFRDVIASIYSINQAILQIQLLINTKKVIVGNSAVTADQWEEFKKSVFKVNSIIRVNTLDNIRFEDVSSDVLQQYKIIENNFERVQQVLHINDSFLGMSNASDSGRKVNMQRTSSIVALRYVVTRLEYCYKIIGLDTIHLINQYYNAEMQINNDDPDREEEQFTTVNKPMMETRFNEETGDIEGREAYMYDRDENGEWKRELLNESSTELIFDRLDIRVQATNYDDAAEADKLMLEQILQGPVGTFVQQADPASFLKIASLSTRQKRVRHSKEISDILMELANKMQQAPTMDPRTVEGEGQGPNEGMSSSQNIAHTLGLSNEIKGPRE